MKIIAFAKLFVRLSLISAIVAFLISAYFFGEQRKEADAAAQAAGFADAEDQDRAGKAGVTDPTIWRQRSEAEAAVKAALAAKEAEAERERRRNPADMMSVSNFKWSTGGFGAVAIANSITIKNDNSFAVKDIELTCHFSAPSGTVLSRLSHTIYDTVKAKAKRTFSDVNLGFVNSQSQRAACAVEKAARL